MSDVAIRVENLSKMYRIGEKQARYKTIRETAMETLAAPLRRLRRVGKPAPEKETIWALKDVSFEVKQGEVLGIIGRNGAGKTTLLKVLSRITEPTEGRAEIHGRVGSLLEVGTGFHPELTGRENIYLNGAVLGMARAEIDRKFDEIVDFAEIEQFLDTPVKRYSSGMYVRLAFAVAAHLEPEILLVDEVLAVGDVAFQKKCMGKMGTVAREGRTVLFVSHSMQAIKRLCETAILVEEGRLSKYGDADIVINSYLSEGNDQTVNAEISPAMHLHYPPDLEVFRVELLDRNNEPTTKLLMDEPFSVRISYVIHVPEQSYRIGVLFRNSDGTRLASTVNTDDGMPHLDGKNGVKYEIAVESQNIFLPGDYSVEVHVKTFFNKRVDAIEGIQFSVESVSAGGARSYGAGVVRLNTRWSLPEMQVG